MRILVCSDNHGDKPVLEEITRMHPQIDLFIHAGDSELSPGDLNPFISVRGNNDYFDFPLERIIETEMGKIYICHGHLLSMPIEQIARHKGASLAIHGHTHRRRYDNIRGITIVCPGSLSFPRGNNPRSYAIIEKNSLSSEWKVTFYSID